MKKNGLLFITSIIFGCIIFHSCNKKDNAEPLTDSGRLTFSLDKIYSINEVPAQKSLKSKDEAVSVIISVKDSQGKIIYNQKKLNLFNLNGSYITETILLNEGSYELTEFLVLDKEDKIIYLTPMENSNYAHLVSDPLSISFDIKIDKITKLIPEVISTSCNCNPNDFGYAGMDFNIVEFFCILINVQVFDETAQNYIFIPANITIEGDGKLIYNGELKATTDSVMIPDGYKEYKILISREDLPTLDTIISNEKLKVYREYPLNILYPFPFLIDIEGNLYRTIKICNQVWMASNLRTKTKNDGTSPVMPPPIGFSPDYLDYGDPSLEAVYGLLYNHEAGLYVPNGWHIPSDEEWMELELCLGMDASELELIGERGTTQGDMLKPGGSTGFNALMGGKAHWTFLYDSPAPGYYYELDYEYVGSQAYFRTSTVNSWDEFYPDYIYRAVGDSYSGIRRNAYHSRAVHNYYSVRCIKD